MVLINSKPSSLEFQCQNEAWHQATWALQGKTLLVAYYCYSGSNERFNSADFKDMKELEGFSRRFRPTSVQLKDNECYKVSKGMTVCASYEFGTNDVRFYDAVVVEVDLKDHKFATETVCTCTFALYWLCGPNMGKTTEAVVSQICLIQPQNPDMDQTLSNFLEICRKKLKRTSECSGTVSKGAITNSRSKSSCSESHGSSKEVKMYKPSDMNSKGSIDHSEMTGKHRELGGHGVVEQVQGETNGSYFIVIENLEKDLSSSTIVDFVRKHVSITSEAQIFPGLSSESYNRGIIISDSQQELKKLSMFLHNPAHMILSSRGRPWVIAEKKIFHGAARAKIKVENPQCSANLDEIRIVSRGTREYELGKQLEDLFFEFADHQKVLRERLAFEEGRILLDVPMNV